MNPGLRAAARQELLVRALREPARLPALAEADWDLLVRRARAARLLARLALRARSAGVWEGIPAVARRHLEWSLVQVARHRLAVRFEVEQLEYALGDLGIPWLLLKGAAYLQAGSPAALGRVFNDIDILVPRESLGLVEQRLNLHGWLGTGHSAYDQRYYRQWMHELPPLEHRSRRSQLDVHHHLLPPHGRWPVASEALFEAARPAPGLASSQVPDSADLLLHSAAHLFSDGELGHGLRDLSDLDLLLRELLPSASATAHLLARARLLGLERALWLALRYTAALLDTPVPPELFAALQHAAPPSFSQQAFDATYLRVLRPWHQSLATTPLRLAHLGVYLRGHWLRMPLHLLLPHLIRKALLSDEAGSKA